MPVSKTDDWSTPKELFDKYDSKYHFGLDAAASNENKLCENYFGLDHIDPAKRDGLTAEWAGYGTIWCNPPYGRIIGKWVEKAFTADNTVVLLLPARTDTIWFHELWSRASDIRFIKGRLKFGGSKIAAPFPSLVAIL